MKLTFNRINKSDEKRRLAAKNLDVRVVSVGRYVVTNNESKSEYDVLRMYDEWACGCPSFKHNHGWPCKHIYAAQWRYHSHE